jgi:hypothetical protein
MKRTLFHLLLVSLLIGLFCTTVCADQVFSVTAGVKDIGAEVIKHAGSQVKDGFILVPEPSSIILLGSGVLALSRFRSKRNRKDD